MKKQLLLIISLVFAFIACDGPTGPPGRDGLDGKDGDGVKWHIETFKINKSDWVLEKFDDGYSYWWCEKPYKDLTNDVYVNGVVIGYIILNPGNIQTEVLAPLEYTIYDLQDIEGEVHQWAETYSFDYMPGSVAFYLRTSDFFEPTEVNDLPEREFRVVLMY